MIGCHLNSLGSKINKRNQNACWHFQIHNALDHKFQSEATRNHCLISEIFFTRHRPLLAYSWRCFTVAPRRTLALLKDTPCIAFLYCFSQFCLSSPVHCHSLLDSEWPACWRIVVPWGSLAQCPAHPKIFFNNGRRHALARGCFEKQFPALRGGK